MSSDTRNFTKDDSWALVFHHNSYKGYFGNKQRALYNHNEDLFSVLGQIDDSYKINGVFEFSLVYPEFPGFAQWTQTINPLCSEPNKSNGYQEIYFGWKYINAATFDGLGLSSRPSSNLLDGTRNKLNRHYAIGLYSSICPEGDRAGTLPGPQWSYNGKYFHIADLYMRIKSITELRRLYSIISFYCKRRTPIFPLAFSQYLFVFSFS